MSSRNVNIDCKCIVKIKCFVGSSISLHCHLLTLVSLAGSQSVMSELHSRIAVFHHIDMFVHAAMYSQQGMRTFTWTIGLVAQNSQIGKQKYLKYHPHSTPLSCTLDTVYFTLLSEKILTPFLNDSQYV